MFRLPWQKKLAEPVQKSQEEHVGGPVPPSVQPNLQPVIISAPLEKRLSLVPNFNFLAIFGALFLVSALGAAIYFVSRPGTPQNVGSKAVGGSKTGCNISCSGDPPGCSGNTCDVNYDTNSYSNCGKNNCSAVTVAGMPDSMDAWGVVNPTYNQPVTCTSRDSQKADCSCQTPNGVTYCWLGLESLAKNADIQGRRWAVYTYDKATNKLKSGGPTSWVLYDDNTDHTARWGNRTYFGTEGVLNCGDRKEFREQADLFSPGSWVETGQIIYAEPAGCQPTTVGCNQSCDAAHTCGNGLTCTSGKCINATCPTTQDTSCACPQPGQAACQMVTSTPADLSKTKPGDTITFIGSGTTTANGDKIDLIEFIASWNNSVFADDFMVTTQDTANSTSSLTVWKATDQVKAATAGAYTVQIKAHWLKSGGVDGGWQL